MTTGGSNNITPFLSDGLQRLQKQREESASAALAARRAEGDITVKREALRLVSSQEPNKFNPLPGTLSENPRRDLADQKGPGRFDTAYAEVSSAIGKLPVWATALIMAVVLFVIVRGFKRG